MIEVIVKSDSVTSVSVEAETAEEAIAAAVYVGKEEKQFYGNDPEIFFCVDGDVVRRSTLRSLGR